MAMYKKANEFPVNEAMPEEFVVMLPADNHNSMPDDEVVLNTEDFPSNEDVVELAPPEAKMEISFELPFLPGCPDEEVDLADSTETKLEEDDGEEKDKSKAADQPKDLNWVKTYLDKIPRHKGETIGLERAKSYLGRASNMLSKLVQEDYDGKIDISKAEEARVSIEKGIDRLEKELQRRKKKASKENGITKEAQKAPAVGGVIVTVPLIVSSIARVCINSTISGGKDIEDTFKKLAKKYNLTDREKVEVIQLLSDMNFPLRRDMGFMIDDKDPYSMSSEDNFDFPPNYDA